MSYYLSSIKGLKGVVVFGNAKGMIASFPAKLSKGVMPDLGQLIKDHKAQSKKVKANLIVENLPLAQLNSLITEEGWEFPEAVHYVARRWKVDQQQLTNDYDNQDFK